MTSDRQRVIWAAHDEILRIYDEQCLDSIRGVDGEYELNGKNMLLWFFRVSAKVPDNPNNIDFYMVKDEVINSSEEIMYFVAHLFLYRDYMNNPMNEAFTHNDTVVYPNKQNLEAKRYAMMLNVVSERLYNYWDKIGDMIWAFHQDALNQRSVYFAKLIEVIKERYQENGSFQWILDFKENDFTEINRRRKNNVHYYSSDTEFRAEHLEGATDEEKMQKLIEQRYAEADFYKGQLFKSLIGFEKTLQFLDDEF